MTNFRVFYVEKMLVGGICGRHTGREDSVMGKTNMDIRDGSDIAFFAFPNSFPASYIIYSIPVFVEYQKSIYCHAFIPWRA